MEKVSSTKKLSIVKQYLSGLSYDEIAAKSTVSKGTVANVVAELKAGKFPEAADAPGHIEQLRELSHDLKGLKLTPGQCTVGLMVLARINKCGLDPADIDRWPQILKAAGNEDEAQEFVKLVYSIQDVQKETGLSLDALDKKAHDLEKKAADLEPISGKLADCQKQLAELTNQRKALANAVTALEGKRKVLEPQVKDLEKSEQDLSSRIKNLEPRAKKAETTLTVFSKEMQSLQNIGFTFEGLAEFSERVQVIAVHHAIMPADLRARLLHELGSLNQGLGLEALIQDRKQKLDDLEQAIISTSGVLETTQGVVNSLKQEKTNLEASIKETREQVGREIAKIIPLAKDTINQLAGELRHGLNEVVAEVRQLKGEVLEVGKEVGRYEGMLEVNQWLIELLALIRGEESVEGQRVRVVALSVIRGVAVWLKRHSSESYTLSSLSSDTDGLMRALEQWKT